VVNIVWDMETNDPDDFLTLLLLAGHPQVHLKAVTVLPGSPEQIDLIRYALREWFQLDIPIGSHNLNTTKPSVSPWHYEAYGKIAPSRDARPAVAVLLEYCDSETTLLTGAALTNLRSAINSMNSGQPGQFSVGQLIAQGGFAGEGVVPHELQIDKFKGMTTYPTHNLIGDNKATRAVLGYKGIAQRFFVAKNVCHRVYYDKKMHDIVGQIRHDSLALTLIWQGMELYLRENPVGKMLHDPLAACCAIDKTIGTWVEVELYREGNAWGSRLAPGSNTWIILLTTTTRNLGSLGVSVVTGTNRGMIRALYCQIWGLPRRVPKTRNLFTLSWIIEIPVRVEAGLTVDVQPSES
jgi:inosine-uridine nucleoside N-ribohydrolase